jgi:RNA 3'-terminal phosphate cyclase (ATP)
LPQVSAPILIDGSYGEGGGALVRTALCMAALTQTPIRIDQVRGGTSYPGLDAEDLLLIQALTVSCAAETTGVEKAASSFSFLPTRLPAGLNLELTALEGLRGANANVVLNALVPVLARCGVYSRVSAQGETYGHRSLSFDYFENITLTALKKLGIYAFPELEKAGFGREAKGVVAIEVEPSVIEGFKWEERGKLQACHGLIVTSHLPRDIAERGIAHLKKMAEVAGVEINVEHEDVHSDRPGAHLTLWTVFEHGMGGAAVMGTKGVRIETLAHAAFEELLIWLKSTGTVDPFLADQILLPAAFAENGCSFTISRLTERFMTSVWVIKQFLPIHITVKGSIDGPGSVVVKR